MNTDDTIVAIGSPPGAAQRGIVRLSGPDAFSIAAEVFSPANIDGEESVHDQSKTVNQTNPLEIHAPNKNAPKEKGPNQQRASNTRKTRHDQGERDGALDRATSAPPPLQGGARRGAPTDHTPTNDESAHPPSSKFKTTDNNTKIAESPTEPRWQRGTLHIDQHTIACTAAFYLAIKSYTGQPSVEFHLLGAPTLLGWLVERCLTLGARQAGPGEFTARAFLAGRLDIAQVHGVAGLIAANSDGQLRAAERLLHGALSQVAMIAREQLADLISLVEGAMDFADEPIEFITADELSKRLGGVKQSLESTRAAGVQAERWESLPRVVLVGQPNAGKSSLFNALLGNDRAMATPVAGTTRDSLTARLDLPRGACRLVDVAGWGVARDAIDASAQVIAEREAADAALRILVVDLATLDLDAVAATLQRLTAPTIVVGNKMDVVGATDPANPRNSIERKNTTAESDDAGASDADHATNTKGQGGTATPPGRVGATNVESFVAQISGFQLASPDVHVSRCITVSAKTGDGIDAIRSAIANVLNATDDHGAQHAIALMAEHRQALDNALTSITRASDKAARCDESLEDADLVALEMRTAAEALGQLVGMDQTEEMLGRIFSRFCVGK